MSLLCLVVSVSLLAVLVSRPLKEKRKEALKTSLLAHQESFVFENVTRTFVVGVNGAVDVIVPALALLANLNVSPNKGADKAKLESLQDLGDVFSHFFGKGSAAERPFADEALFKTIVDAAQSIQATELYIGGNAALMGDYLASQNVGSNRVVMATVTGPVLKRLLPANIVVPPVFTAAAVDEYHIIMEYKRGERWGDLMASRANRFIFSHDRTNAELQALEPWEVYMKNAPIDRHATYIVSGVHMLEGESEALQSARIQKLATVLGGMKEKEAVIHLELASIHGEGLMKLCFEHVLPRVTSLGLNEQELGFLAMTLGIDGWESVSQSGDSVESVILELFKRLPEDSLLSRVHFHTLHFHVVVAKEGAWSSVAASVASGVLTCARRACEDEYITLANYDLHSIMHKPEVVERIIDGFVVANVPAFTCKHPTKTVGLGDSISAAGLLHTVYTQNANR
eukprot:m.44663 g.44663  ORF g.44663 m.44663 type:complete len:456 (+) comp7184_c0_seq1:52-1419(+)